MKNTKRIKIILSILVLLLSSYSLLTRDFTYSPLTSLSAGLLVLAICMEEIRKGKGRLWNLIFLATILLFGLVFIHTVILLI